MVLARALAERLNLAQAPVTLVLPDGGFCEAAAKDGPMYDPEADRAFLDTIQPLLKPEIKVVNVSGNINDPVCQKAVADAVMELVS